MLKKRTERDTKYLEWLREQPCLKCGIRLNIHSHHTESGGMGIKGSDYSAIPLCAYHHAELHATTGKRGDWTHDQLTEIITRLRANYEER